MASIAHRAVFGAALVPALALALSCQTRAPTEERESPAAKATERAREIPAPDRRGPSRPDDGPIPLPAEVAPVAFGTVEPAPWLEEALRVAAVRVPAARGRKGSETLVVAAGLRWLRLHRPDGELVAETSAPGGAQLLEVLDVTGDGRDDILIGRGVVRGALGVPASLRVHLAADLTGEPEKIPLPDSTRSQVVGVAPASGRPGDLYVAAFESKYMTGLFRARRHGPGDWRIEKLGSARVVGGIASVSRPGAEDRALVVARIYGDGLEEPGLVEVRLEGELELVPSTRGARAIVALPSDTGDLVFADGWHKNYGQMAQALLTRGHRGESAWESHTLARVGDRFGYDRLRIGDVGGDGQIEVLAAGNGPAVAVNLRPGAPVRALGDVDATDLYPVDLDGDGADEVILAGPNPGIWRRR